MTDDIRVGLIRCDTHGAYYGPLMQKHDPMRLQMPLPIDRPARYSWQHGGAHFYFYTNYADPRQMTVDAVEGFRLTRLWDEHRDAAECLADVFYDKPLVCDSFAEVSDDVDLLFVADCNGDGSDHLALATPGIEKGIPTFIDKPLAYSVEDTRAILALAERHGAPVTSISILSALPGFAQFAQRLPETGDLQFGTVQGGGTQMAGHIHAINLALRIFGNSVRTVRCMGDTPLNTIHLSYGERPDRPARGVTINCDVGAVWHCAFHVSAYGTAGAIHSPPLGDFVFPFGAAEILRMVKAMVVTGEPPPITADMLEGVAVAEAARLAQHQGRSVEIAEVGVVSL